MLRLKTEAAGLALRSVTLSIHISQLNFDLFDNLLQQVSWQFIYSEGDPDCLIYHIYKKSSDNAFVSLRIDAY